MNLVIESAPYNYRVENEKDKFVWARGLSLERAVHLASCLNAVGEHKPENVAELVVKAEEMAIALRAGIAEYVSSGSSFSAVAAIKNQDALIQAALHLDPVQSGGDK